ncbi:regulatory protein GemA [Kingella negevensis]|uniref:gp16 family protein n=1 Tax=Kingella negevensis TaxID=1522312 RepID=UPI002542E62D|nr:regulatory protein GemA [Kingella negevensis]WII93166.1 regulatory protein GemA [Kingella negevensis]
MQKQADTRKKKIGKIHVGKTKLGLDDDTYRAMLMAQTGKNSCAQMTDWELDRVLSHLKTKGFGDDKPDVGRMPLRQAQHTPMMKKIEALLLETDKTWQYAHGIARKMFGKDTVQQCDSVQMHKIVAALQYHANRQKTKVGA